MELIVDPEWLAQRAADCHGAATEMFAALDTLAQSSHVLRSQWTGAAQAAYTQRALANDARWRDHATTLLLAAQRTERLAEEYHRADADAARAIFGI